MFRVCTVCGCDPLGASFLHALCSASTYGRRAFSAADAVRHDLLSNWALNPSHKRRTESEGANGGPQNGGYFADRMDDVRQRLLDVLGVDHGTLEVCSSMYRAQYCDCSQPRKNMLDFILCFIV